MKRNNSYYLKWSSFFSALTLYTPIVPLYFLSHGIGLTQVVLSQAAYSVAVLLFEVPTGVLADRFGHRKSVIVSGLVDTAAVLIALFSPTLLGLYVSYLMFGLGEAFQSGSSEALLFESTKAQDKRKNYQKHLSHMFSLNSLAFAVGTATVGVVYGMLGARAFIPLIVATAAGKFLSFIINTRLHDVHAKGNEFSGSGMWQLFRKSVGQIKRDSTLRNIAYVRLLTLPAIYVVYSSFQSYFQDNGVSPYFIGLVLTLGGLANAVLMRQAHLLERWLSLDKAVLYLNLLLGLTYLAFSVVSSPWALVLIYVLMQAQYNLQDPIISDYINDRTATGIRASILSGISLIRQIGNTGNKILLGLSLTPFGVTGMLRIQAAYLVFGSFLSYWLLVRCGCVYKLNHSYEPAGETPNLEPQTAET